MLASKHKIYLTKNYRLENSEIPTNVFLFNENGPHVQSQWIKKNIDCNDGTFIVLDHDNNILKAVEKRLYKRNYYTDVIDFNDPEKLIHINPFDLVTNTSEIHFMFLNMLYIMWDNDDPDLPAMSNLIDAFASCVFSMFATDKTKMTMATLKKMISSVRATMQTPDGPVMLSDAIFAKIQDQESMPCKYYAQFNKATGDRKQRVAEKVAILFDSFTDMDLAMMSETDESLSDEIGFKTAMFINVDDERHEHSAKLLLTLMNYFVQTLESHQKTMFILDKLDSENLMVSLPYWLKEAPDNDMSFIICCNNLASFKIKNESERFFKNLQKNLSASVLIHHKDKNTKKDVLPTSSDTMNDYLDDEYIATVLVGEDIKDQDVLF